MEYMEERLLQKWKTVTGCLNEDDPIALEPVEPHPVKWKTPDGRHLHCFNKKTIHDLLRRATRYGGTNGHFAITNPITRAQLQTDVPLDRVILESFRKEVKYDGPWPGLHVHVEVWDSDNVHYRMAFGLTRHDPWTTTLRLRQISQRLPNEERLNVTAPAENQCPFQIDVSRESRGGTDYFTARGSIDIYNIMNWSPWEDPDDEDADYYYSKGIAILFIGAVKALQDSGHQMSQLWWGDTIAVHFEDFNLDDLDPEDLNLEDLQRRAEDHAWPLTLLADLGFHVDATTNDIAELARDGHQTQLNVDYEGDLVQLRGGWMTRYELR